MAVHGHGRLGGGRPFGIPTRLARWNSSSVVGCVLFGIQVSGTYWSLRYRVGLRVRQQRQLVLRPRTLLGWAWLKV